MSVEKTFNPETFAERLKGLRIEKGVGQNKLAEDLSLSNASISYWENCKQEPTAGAIFKLANYFGTTSDYLIGLDE